MLVLKRQIKGKQFIYCYWKGGGPNIYIYNYVYIYIIIYNYIYNYILYIYICMYILQVLERTLIPINRGKPNNDDSVKSQLRR